MPLSRSEKEAMVSEVSEVAAEALSLVGADYRGVDAENLRGLRRKAFDEGVYLKVVKNTLAKIAVKGTEFECAAEDLSGPMILAFSSEDPGAGARIFKDFAKENDQFEVKIVSVGGQSLPGSDLDKLAKMPTRDQALGQLAGLMLAPISKFVRTVAEPNAKFVRTVAAVKEAKEAA